MVEQKWNFIVLSVTNCQRRLAVKFQFIALAIICQSPVF